MSIDSNEKYNGQALLVVLTILIVAAIIALAIVSRVRSDQVSVTQERSSSQSSTVASEIINTVGFEPITNISTAVNNDETLTAICNTSNLGSYDLLDNGCVISDYTNVNNFLKTLSTSLGNDSFNAVATQIDDQLVSSCGDDYDVTLTIKPVEENEPFTIANGSTISLINDGLAPLASGCSVNINAETTAAGVNAGIVERATYVNNTQGFKAYDYGDVNAYCLFDCATNADWQGINDDTRTNGWNVSPGSASFTRAITVNDGSNDYYMDELRLMAVAGDITASYSTAPTGCADVGTMMKVTTVVTCAGTSQGKEVLLPKDSWAPAIFDYVLYNGSGTLEYSAN